MTRQHTEGGVKVKWVMDCMLKLYRHLNLCSCMCLHMTWVVFTSDSSLISLLQLSTDGP